MQKKSEDEASGNKPAGAIRNCFSCNKHSEDLKKCTHCKVALYCNNQCQRAHWSQHKQFCGRHKEEMLHAKDPISINDIDCSRDAKCGEDEKGGINEEEMCWCCQSQKQKLLICAQCKIAKYCDKDCQRAHWPHHKTACRQQDTKDLPPDDCDEEPGKCCLFCKGDVAESVYCSECEVAEYCSLNCKAKHHAEHRKSCKNYPEFMKAMKYTSPIAAKVMNCCGTDMLMPPKPRGTLDYILSDLQKQKRALLLNIVATYQHSCRLGVWVQDIHGEKAHMLFYHEKHAELSLQSSLTQMLHPGNFIRWFSPVWHFFADGTVGFRIDTLHDIEYLAIRIRYIPD